MSEQTVQPPLPNRSFLGAFGLLERGERFLVVQNRRLIGGRPTLTWDVPGGGVEPGETLAEALVREMREEVGVEVRPQELVFVSEGERVERGARRALWRSFFFTLEHVGGAVDLSGDPEILDHRWVTEAEALELFRAPYHGGFRRFLTSRRTLRFGFDRWED